MELYARLKGFFPHLACSAEFDFSRHTTIGCGGIAAAEACPESAEQAVALFARLRRESIPYVLLGAGANVLPPDGRYEGVVVRFGKFCALRREGDGIFAGAGVTGGAFLAFAQAHGIGGFSPFSGIPMTVGGGVAMNAGVRELHFSDVAEEVIAADGKKVYRLDRKACRFGEKTSVFQEGIAVLGVRLAGRASAPQDIARASCYFRTRRRSLPKGRSMGCVFVNPTEKTAGALIEACGLKGTRVGGAVVSEVHANFILNEGGTSADVASLIELVKNTVKMRTGVLLREEIHRIL